VTKKLKISDNEVQSSNDELSNQEDDFFASLKKLGTESSTESTKRTKSALHKWGTQFEKEKFEPLPRIFLENLDVFQFKGSELQVLIQILMWWTDRSRWPTCHYETIASRTGLSTRIIMDTLKRLEEKSIVVPKFEYVVVKNRPAMYYKPVKWSKKGLLKRLKFNELPADMRTRSNNGARFFDLTNLIEICTHLLQQKEQAQKGAESINMVRQLKTSEEVIDALTSSKGFKEYARFLRKHQ